MIRQTCGQRCGARLAVVLMALCVLIQSGCLVISWDWSKGEPFRPSGAFHSAGVQTFNTDLATADAACRHALRDARIVSDNGDGTTRTIEATQGKEKLKVEIKQEANPASSPRTVVRVRTTQGTDVEESLRVLQQVDAYLAGTVTAARMNTNGIVTVSGQ